MLTGDNRFLRLAPFNTRYERQLAHLHDVGVRLDVPNKWDSPLVLQGEGARVDQAMREVGVRLDVPNKWDSPLVLQGERAGADQAMRKVGVRLDVPNKWDSPLRKGQKWQLARTGKMHC